jgi:hypothetical protein
MCPPMINHDTAQGKILLQQMFLVYVHLICNLSAYYLVGKDQRPMEGYFEMLYLGQMALLFHAVRVKTEINIFVYNYT